MICILPLSTCDVPTVHIVVYSAVESCVAPFQLIRIHSFTTLYSLAQAIEHKRSCGRSILLLHFNAGMLIPVLIMYSLEPIQAYVLPRVHNPPECATPIQFCIGSWSSGIGSSNVMRTVHTSARPVSRQGTVVFDPRVPATPRVPLRGVRYNDAKIRLRSTKTLHRAGSGVAHSGGLCTLGPTHVHLFYIFQMN